MELAATDAVNLAIQNTRYTFDAGSPNQFLNNATPELCATYAVPGQASTVNVYCSMVWQPYSAEHPGLHVLGLQLPQSLPANAGADCAAQPLLQAIVAFDDYPSGVAAPNPNPSPCQKISSNGFCGESMTQISWQWNPVVPAITSLSSSSGPTSGGTTVTIQGTGFTSGETVNFVQQLSQPPSGTTYNPPVAATIVANPSPAAVPSPPASR